MAATSAMMIRGRNLVERDDTTICVGDGKRGKG
jgi:hypothetical protein